MAEAGLQRDYSFGVSVSNINPESSLGKLVERFTKLWWRFDAMLERWKMSMKDHRIDTDYNPDDETIRKLTRAIGQLIEKPRSNNYYNGGGDKKALNWILGVLAMLVVSGVVGGIALYGRLSSLESTVNSGITAHEQRIRRLEDINERRYREEK